MKIVKLGGSVITFKDLYRALRRDVAFRLLKELHRYFVELGKHEGLAIVHGGGSYGHPLVKECLLKQGKIDHACYAETADSMDTLNYILRKYALSIDLPVVSLPPRSFCLLVSKRPLCELRTVGKLLSRGLVPLTYGDVVISDEGFDVLSGDTVAWYLAKELGASEVLFVTAVDGLYDSDPTINPHARKIREASINEVLNYLFHSSSSVDVTGGMRRKLIEGRLLGLREIKVKIVGGLIEGNLYSALISDNFVGSIIWY